MGGGVLGEKIPLPRGLESQQARITRLTQVAFRQAQSFDYPISYIYAVQRSCSLDCDLGSPEFLPPQRFATADPPQAMLRRTFNMPVVFPMPCHALQ